MAIASLSASPATGFLPDQRLGEHGFDFPGSGHRTLPPAAVSFENSAPRHPVPSAAPLPGPFSKNRPEDQIDIVTEGRGSGLSRVVTVEKDHVDIGPAKFEQRQFGPATNMTADVLPGAVTGQQRGNAEAISGLTVLSAATDHRAGLRSRRCSRARAKAAASASEASDGSALRGWSPALFGCAGSVIACQTITGLFRRIRAGGGDRAGRVALSLSRDKVSTIRRSAVRILRFPEATGRDRWWRRWRWPRYPELFAATRVRGWRRRFGFSGFSGFSSCGCCGSWRCRWRATARTQADHQYRP